MTPQELKNSILQLAIQGRLVEQRPDEGTAEELVRQIQREKAALVKAGKIKKEKPLPEITEEEVPFEIPEGWKWVRILEIGSFISGFTPKPVELSPVGIMPYFKVSDMNTFGNELYLSVTDQYLKNKPKRFFLCNTIVYPKNGGAVFTNKKRILAQDSVVDLNTGGFYPLALLDLMYVFYFFLQIDFRKCYKGTALPTIDMEQLTKKLFPLPPLAEQKRIVAKIEELLPYIDRYEKAWSRLEDFNKRFPTDMQKSILQLAIQGKFVPQRPEEGTGEALYRQIQAEKQSLIRSGKLKKGKPLPEITPDEIPFDIPESWKLIRLGDVISLLSGTDFKPEEYNDQGIGTPYITGASSLSDTGVIVNRWTETPRNIANHGDVLLVCKGSGYGKTVICDIAEAHVARQIMAIKKSNWFDMQYIRYFLNANISLIKANGQGVIPGIDRSSVLKMVFPLPPLAEQKRIVVKLEELLPLCERLK